MARFAVMMLCNAGSLSLIHSPLQWRVDKHVVCVVGTDSEADAYAEVARLRPRGFDREQSRYWVVPWCERYDPHHWPQAALPYWR